MVLTVEEGILKAACGFCRVTGGEASRTTAIVYIDSSMSDKTYR